MVTGLPPNSSLFGISLPRPSFNMKFKSVGGEFANQSVRTASRTGGGIAGRTLALRIFTFISIIPVIFLLMGAIPEITKQTTFNDKVWTGISEIFFPIVASDNQLYFEFSKAREEGLHSIEKPDKLWCVWRPCPSWWAYNKETLIFIGNVFSQLWFTFAILYILYFLISKSNTSEVWKNTRKTLIVYIVILLITSPIMWQFENIGKPIPHPKENLQIYIPFKGVFAVPLYLMGIDFFFYESGKENVFERINYTGVNES